MAGPYTPQLSSVATQEGDLFQLKDSLFVTTMTGAQQGERSEIHVAASIVPDFEGAPPHLRGARVAITIRTGHDAACAFLDGYDLTWLRHHLDLAEASINQAAAHARLGGPHD